MRFVASDRLVALKRKAVEPDNKVKKKKTV
jgi:hypothetical protein